MLRFLHVYAKELKTDGVAATEEMAQLVDQALQKYQNSQNLPYFKAIVLLSLGQKEEALKYYRDLILRYPSKFYLWHQAAELVEDVETKIGLLCKAISVCADESFLGGVRLSLAKLLIEKGLLANARTELDRYRKTYQSKGWGLKPEFWGLSNRIPGQTVPEDNSPLYAKYCAYADKFIYDSIPSVMAVKVFSQKFEDRNHPGRTFTQWTLKGENQIYRLKKPAKFGLDNRTQDGTMFEVKAQDNKIVWISEIKEASSVSWLKVVSGTVALRTDRNGKSYTMIGGVYVPEKLVRNLSEGQSVNILAIKQENGRWQALAIKK